MRTTVYSNNPINLFTRDPWRLRATEILHLTAVVPCEISNKPFFTVFFFFLETKQYISRQINKNRFRKYVIYPSCSRRLASYEYTWRFYSISNLKKQPAAMSPKQCLGDYSALESFLFFRNPLTYQSLCGDYVSSCWKHSNEQL